LDRRARRSACFDLGVPVLGICYGQMAMCIQNGGKAEGSDHREFGRAFVEVHKASPLFEGVWDVGTGTKSG
jgi:GMP synthase (glutamine-hydrolysing)